VTSSEFTVSFALPGYHPQTVPVRVVASADGSDAEQRLVPNPVFVELQPAGPPVAARKPAPVKKKPKPGPRPAPTAMAPEQAPSPAPAPASPWPPAR
jgi:cell division septation protein DedD